MRNIYKFTKNLVFHPLFSGSAVMIIGSNLANFIAYIYHVVIGRLLGPVFYGELSAVLSILGIVFASFNFLGLVIVKFVSSSDKEELESLYSWFVKKVNKYGALLSLIILLLIPVLGNFLHIKATTLIMIVPIIYMATLAYVFRSFLQGLMKFKEVVIAVNAEFILRLTLGVIFIYLGFSTFGAVFAIVLSTFISLLLLRYFLKELRRNQNNKVFSQTTKIIRYAVPIFFASIATNSLFSTDVILVKHFFSAHDAGIYASLSTLGKIIFYGAGPIGAVMFPMISQRHSRGQNYSKVFYLSILLTLVISLSVLSLYKFFPDIAINILFGNKFLEGSSYLFQFGIFMTLFTLASLIFNYFLSREKTKVVYIVIVVALMQALGIFISHATILNVINVSIISSAFFLLSMLTYFIFESSKS